MAEKILFTTSVPKSGLGTYVEFLMNEFKKHNYRMKLAQFVYCRKGEHFENAEAKKGITLMSNTWFVNDLLKLQQSALKKAIDPDTKLIHFSDTQSLPDTKVLNALKRRKIALVCTVHDMIDAIIGDFNYHVEEPRTLNFVRRLLKKDRTSISIEYCKRLSLMDYIVTQSKYTKKDLITVMTLLGYDFPEEKIIPIYRGFNEKVFKKLSKSKKELRSELELPVNKVIIFNNGSEEPRKNVATLYKALKLLPENYILIRNGHTSAANKKLIEKLNIKHRVFFFRGIPNDKLVKLFNASDLFVFPAIYEGFGMPPLEAMACGIPVISNDFTSLKEVLDKNALLCNDPYDEKELSKKIINLTTNKKMLDEYTKKALLNASRKEWFEYYKNILKVYEKSLKLTLK